MTENTDDDSGRVKSWKRTGFVRGVFHDPGTWRMSRMGKSSLGKIRGMMSG